MSYTNGLDDPSAYFQVNAYQANTDTPSQTFTNNGNSDLKPDWLWVKNRSGWGARNHLLWDSSRGVNKYLRSNTTNAELTSSNQTFNTNGFTVPEGFETAYSGAYVAWQWKANGGTTSSNTDGTVTSTVQVNTDAGFSIVTWTTGLLGGNHSVGHGLGVKPAMFITKSRGGTSSWWTWHQGMAGDTSYVNLQLNTAELTFSDIWGDGITSSVFGYNYPATVNANQTYIAYCFAEKQGYSKFGNYKGVGSGSPFVYTGFKPALVICKRTDSTNDWGIVDSKRETYNGATKTLFADLTNAESSTYTVDLLSNGFRPSSNHSIFNQSGGSYIYMAFAENPFVTSTGIPTTAR